jgi:hypothetical protein
LQALTSMIATERQSGRPVDQNAHQCVCRNIHHARVSPRRLVLCRGYRSHTIASGTVLSTGRRVGAAPAFSLFRVRRAYSSTDARFHTACWTPGGAQVRRYRNPHAMSHIHRCRTCRSASKRESRANRYAWNMILLSDGIYMEMYVDPSYGPLKPNQRQDYRGE